jgi:predicted MFS family arabinose efflux permease
MIAFRSGSNDRFAVSFEMSLISNASIARPATDLVLAMLVGALTGGVLLRWVALAAPLWLAAVLLVACATGAYLAARRPQSQASR